MGQYQAGDESSCLKVQYTLEKNLTCVLTRGQCLAHHLHSFAEACRIHFKVNGLFPSAVLSDSDVLVFLLIRSVTSWLFFFFDMVSSGFGTTYFPHMSLPLELHVATFFKGNGEHIAGVCGGE